MTTRFLAQLAHRAVAGPDVRPRTLARFENSAPLEQHSERLAPATPAPVSAVDPAPLTAQTESRAAPATATHAYAAPTALRIVAREPAAEHILERVVERPAPPAASGFAPRQESPIATFPLSSAPDAAGRDSTSPAGPPRATPVVWPAQPPAPARPAVQPMPDTSKDESARVAEAPRAPAPTAILQASVLPAAATPTLAVRSAPEPATAPAPAPIEIVIGRIEIRTEAPPSLPAARTRGESRKPAMSLETYLRGRGERGR